MPTHASRNTTTGLRFEEATALNGTGIDVSKTKLKRYVNSLGIDYNTIVSRELRPDEAYFYPDTKHLDIYEKKYQETEGSADEKPQTCGFKIHEFNKIGKAIGAEKITYTYILSDWFKKDIYRDMLDYIKSVPNCDYKFM